MRLSVVGRTVVAIGLIVPATLLSLGAVATSASPPSTWTVATAPSSPWRAITYAQGQFVVVGDGSQAITSTNGQTWSSHTVPDGQWDAIAYGAGRFVALSDEGSGNIEMTSVGGGAWSAVPGPSGEWSSIVYGGGRFVAVGPQGQIAISTDGLNWTQTFKRRFDHFTGVAFGNGRYVVVDGDQGDSLESTDAVHWAFYTAPRAGIRWGSVSYGNGQFIAFDANGSGEYGTSVQGFGFFLHPYSPSQTILGSTFGCDSFVGVGAPLSGTNNIFTSPTGLGWTATPVPTGSSASWSGVAYGAYRFVAVDQAGDVAWAPSATYCGPTIPSTPQQVSGNIHSGEVWTYMHPSATRGGAAITGYRATITDGVTTKSCLAAVGYEPNCIIKGLVNHHVYMVTTQAHNAYGWSVPTDPLFVIPVASWTFSASTPGPVVLGTSPFPVQVTGIEANSLGIYPTSLVTVTVDGRTQSCHPSPFGECQFTDSDTTVGAITITANYTGYGRSYSSTHVDYLATVGAPGTGVHGTQVAVGMHGAVPNSIATATVGGHQYAVRLNSAGQGVVLVTAPAAGSYTMTIADDGVVLESVPFSAS